MTVRLVVIALLLTGAAHAGEVVTFSLSVSNCADTAIVRITDVVSDSFSLYVQEAPDQNGYHNAETVNYIGLEAGSWQVADGVCLEVGTVLTDPRSASS